MRKKRITAIVLILALLIAIAALSSCGKEEEQQITKISELNGKSIAVLEGSTFAATVRRDERLQDIDLVYATSTADGLVKLLSGKVDSFVTDNVVAQVLAHKNKGLLILDEAIENSSYGFVFEKDSIYTEEFNAAIARIKADGTYDKILEKWLGDDESAKVMPEFGGSTENGSLICFVEDSYEPICYRNSDGELVGIDIEILRECADRLGYGIEFETRSFSDIIPSVSAGLADIGCSGISITPEREELVDFSDPYMDASTVIMVGDVSEDTTAAGVFQSIENGLRRTFIENGRWKDLLVGLAVTILLTVFTAVIGYALGYGLFLLEYVYPQNKVVNKTMWFICTAISLSPVSTMLYIAYYILFAGQHTKSVVAASIVLITIFCADVYQFYGGHTAHVKKGELEAAESMGYSRWETLKYIIMPQVLPKVLGNLQTEAKMHVRTTAFVGLISVVDIQTVADVVRAETAEPVVPLILTAVVYISLGIIFSNLVAKINIKYSGEEKTQEEIIKNIEMGRL